MIVQKIIKHGSSLAVVIPAAVCKHYNIRRGDVVVLFGMTKEKIGLDFKFSRVFPKKALEEYNNQHNIIEHG